MGLAERKDKRRYSIATWVKGLMTRTYRARPTKSDMVRRQDSIFLQAHVCSRMDREIWSWR
jgi:hypothetical protein